MAFFALLRHYYKHLGNALNVVCLETIEILGIDSLIIIDNCEGLLDDKVRQNGQYCLQSEL